jgi:hypothetical protein
MMKNLSIRLSISSELLDCQNYITLSIGVMGR